MRPIETLKELDSLIRGIEAEYNVQLILTTNRSEDSVWRAQVTLDVTKRKKAYAEPTLYTFEDLGLWVGPTISGALDQAVNFLEKLTSARA